jgi:6-phosphogluconolactonase/glucosamine-6-phosphate isomerase/deaminase
LRCDHCSDESVGDVGFLEVRRDKPAAVRHALEGPVNPRCPASALRRHPGAVLFLDRDSAALLQRYHD